MDSRSEESPAQEKRRTKIRKHREGQRHTQAPPLIDFLGKGISLDLLFYDDLVSQKHDQNHNQDGDHQKSNNNSKRIFGCHLQVVDLHGKLVNLGIAQLIQPGLNLIRGKTELPEPFSDHLNFQKFLNLLHFGRPVQR